MVSIILIQMRGLKDWRWSTEHEQNVLAPMHLLVGNGQPQWNDTQFVRLISDRIYPILHQAPANVMPSGYSHVHYGEYRPNNISGASHLPYA
jgi:hypothetical protein